jgi:hypothetical protein
MQVPSIEVGDRVSVALETNGKGVLGYIVQLPGGFVRGATERDALAKVPLEVKSYVRWLGLKPGGKMRTTIVQWHQSAVAVQDADNDILLDADRRPFRPGEFDLLSHLVRWSGRTFAKLYEEAELKDWVDEERLRRTFYGNNPHSIQEIFDHVKGCHHYYLSRLNAQCPVDTDEFVAIRDSCAGELQRLYDNGFNSTVFQVDNEFWTIKKVFRRIIWHDRIHGKAIVRILEKQQRLGLIDGYRDPFRFLKACLRGPRNLPSL